MKILLDTHIILWALTDSPKMSPKARRLISDVDNDIYISIVSPWEIEIKHDKFPEKMPIDSEELLKYCSQAGFRNLSIRPAHVRMLKELDQDLNSDPFDRMLVCQAMAEDMTLITHDEKIATFSNEHVISV